MTTASPDTAAAIEFLKKFEPDGPWHILAKVGGKSLPARTFQPSEERRAADWIGEHNGTDNLYVSINPPMSAMDKKALRADLKEMRWLHVDIDCRAGEQVEDEMKRIEKLLGPGWPDALPRPTLIINSGGGFWVLWRLETPVPIEGDFNKADDLSLYNLQISHLLTGDNCHNVDRIMRLPGSVNLPDERKRAKGRVAQVATVVEFNDGVHSIESFKKAVVVQTDGGKSLSSTKQVEISDNVERIPNLEVLKHEYNVRDRVIAIVAQGHRARDIYGSKEFGKDDSRSGWLWEGVCGLAKAEVPDQIIYSLLMDPDWGISESILDKGNSAGKHAKRIIARAKDLVKDPTLSEMNDKFAVIGSIGGKCRVVEEVPDLGLGGRTKLIKQTFEDFTNRLRHIKIEVPSKDGPVYVPKGKWWLDHPRRRQFDGLVFAPEGDVEGMYNLWRGFSYEPRQGDCSMYLTHLRENICGGVEENYQYLIKWMARCVQMPWLPGEVAVVLRGEQGAGKSITAKIFGNLMGRHFIQISDSRHLIGNFNSHLRDVLFCLADEAFFAGDKKHESILKTLVTEPTLVIEGKGVDAETSRNCIHIMLASNSNWVVPAGAHERRYYVLDVSSNKRQDNNYFKSMMKQMEAGGYGALMLYLSTMDLEGFVVQRFPRTEALGVQQDYTLSPEESWWYEKLKSGQVMAGRLGWPSEISKEEMFNDWVQHCKDLNITRRLTQTAWWIFAREEMGDPKVGQRVVTVWNRDPRTGVKTQTRERRYLVSLPSLSHARSLWDKRHGKRFWPEVELEEELPMDEAPVEERDPF